jgi:DNA mismatch repair protein MSH4
LYFSQREIAHHLRSESIPDVVSPRRHFSELTKTLSRQPTVIKYVYWDLVLLVDVLSPSISFGIQRSRASAVNFGMTFQYKILDGASEDFSHYGV